MRVAFGQRSSIKFHWDATRMLWKLNVVEVLECFSFRTLGTVHKPITKAFFRWRRKNQEFRVSRFYIVSSETSLG